MNEVSSGQVIASAAETYETFFVPALFAEWAPRMIAAAQIKPEQKVLDIACGTGVLARAVLKQVGSTGFVSGLDCNPDMLTVARRHEPDIDWQLAEAEELPFADNSFDAVLSQFGLMFFTDRVAALKQMWRVLKPGGYLAVAVWDALERTPGYAAMTVLLAKLFGDEIATELRAPFILGDPDQLKTLFTEAGITEIELNTSVGKARFASIEDWVHTDIKGWTLAGRIDDEQYHSLLSVAEKELASYRQSTDEVVFDSPAHIVTCRKALH